MQNDPIIETRICRVSGKEFYITQKDVEFYKKISPKFGDYVAQILFPTLCPEERQRRRLLFRNERKLYRRQCDASKKPIISIYSPDKEYVVYDQKIRWSDEWDAMDYGKEFDFSKTFTDQFDVLLHSVPRPSVLNRNNENSDYSNYTANSKNCYVCTTTAFSEDILYCAAGWYSKDCVDGLNLISSSQCYECINLRTCTKLYYSSNCTDCDNSWYLSGCVGCSYCYNCVDVVNQSYCIDNIMYTKEEYFSRIEGAKKKARKILNESNQSTNTLCENVSGKYLRESSNCMGCYHSNDIHDAKFCSNTASVSDCYDADCFGFKSYLSCELITCEEIRNSFAIQGSINCDFVLYSSLCFDCKNLFGCVGLRNKQYCIFNKQYTKEEYETLVPKIIEYMKETGERGEFFDPSLSPFGYNETVAQEYFPLEKESACERGYHRSEYESPQPQAQKTIQGSDLPNSIELIDDSILKTAIACEITGKLFRIIPQELAFYRKHEIPVPRKHPDQRHLERLAMRK